MSSQACEMCKLLTQQQFFLQALQPVTVRDPSQDDDVAISPPTPAAVQPSQLSADGRFGPDPDDLQVRSWHHWFEQP